MLLIKKTIKHSKAKEEERLIFQNKISEYRKDGKPIVYLDESGFAHDVPCTHGYAVRGERCLVSKIGGLKDELML